MDHHHHQQHHQQHHQHPHQHHSHHQQHHQHHHQQPPSHPMYPTNSSPYHTPQMISTPNFTNPNKFPFSQPPPQQQQQQPTQTTTPASATPPVKPVESMGPPLGSPYSGSGSGGFDPNGQKKKRGRPRKYSPDSGGGGGVGGGGGGGGSSIALGLSPTPISSVVVSPSGGGGGDSTGATPENSSKKNRGRPAGSSKKQLDALGNCGVGFTPHVILVNAGEDIASKIRAFSQQGARTVCVLSANGSISYVDLRQPAMTGGSVKYEGRFEIISLSGSFLFSENSGAQGRPGGLSVSLAGPDGRVLGGGVVGVLRAATPVQIIVGSFIADGKKPKYMPSVPQSHMLNFGAPALPAAVSSPPSQEVSTEGSDENGSNHIDRNMGSYGNSNHAMHHNMQMYSMGWPSSTSKMLQN